MNITTVPEMSENIVKYLFGGEDIILCVYISYYTARSLPKSVGIYNIVLASYSH